MDGDGAGNGAKLRRGRISLDRKREILEQYDLLSKPCSETDAAAIFGVTQATLAKILSERDEIKEAVKKPAPAKVEVDPTGSPKLSRGRMSYEKQREILRLYDELPKCTFSEAATKLGVREATLTKLLASRRNINLGKRKRKKTQSSSDSDESSPNDGFRSVQINDGRARLSPQPGGSGIGTPRGTAMSLRKGRRVRVDYSDDEQSGSDYEQQDSDFANDQDEDVPEVEEKKTRKYHTPAERVKILSKYDAMQPCTQVYAAKILGVTQSLLCSWLKQRNATNSKPKSKKSNAEEDSDYTGEEIDSYVMAPKGSSKKAQVVQFFEVGAEDSNRSKSSNDSNRRAPLSLKDRFELLKKYDAMGSATLKDAAETFNVAKTTWQNLLANRYFFEKEFKAQLRKDMGILNEYDAIENKQTAPKALGMTRHKLEKLLANRGDVEKYYNELIASNEDGESVASGDETESTWKDSKELKALEAELLHWFQQVNNERNVSLKDLKEKAKELASESGMEDFHPSDSWLKKWNKTYRVFWNQKGKLVAIYGFGENRSVSECVLMALKEYPPENVFNLVETGLYYKAVPGCSPSTDDWMVVAFACNMSGTEKKRLLVVGKSEAPLCFRVMSLPLTYKHSTNACMNEHVVGEYLEAWDRELVAEGRKIAIVLDTSSSHPNVPLSRIRLFFVPADCSGDQPLSHGVVAQAKSLYRQRMAASLQSSTYSTAESITIVDALFALAEAWDQVPKALLVSKFLTSTFPQNDDARTELDTKELEILNKLDDNIRLHSSLDGQLDSGDGEGGRVVHMEGTLHLSDEDEEDFDIDSLLRDQDTAEFDAPQSAPDLGSKLKNFLGKTSTPNGSVKGDSEGTGPPTASDVKAALSTIKRFLQHNGGTLEDLTDYTQLEIKVLSKIIKTEPKQS